MEKTVSILGCGWLGLPLGAFLKEKGFAVKGSTTQKEKLEKLAQAGIEPFLLNFTPYLQNEQLDSIPDFLNSEVLIIAIPPLVSKQGEEFHPKQMLHLSEQVKQSPLNKIIYISSTSVYPEANKAVTEDEELSKENTGNNAILRAEEIVAHFNRDITILRCGGLMGYDRIPGKYFAGKKINTGDLPVNYIHQDDVIQAIYEVIRQEKWNRLYNLVAPEHPIRKEVFEKNARQFNLELPIFSREERQDYKMVKSDKLILELSYQFKYPNPLDFSYKQQE